MTYNIAQFLEAEAHLLKPTSTSPDIRWPAIPAMYESRLLAVIWQLEQSQWWPAQTLRANQMEQLSRVLAHVYQSVPFYRNRLDEAGITPRTFRIHEDWERLPVLSRSDVQSAGTLLHAEAIGKEHGQIGRTTTSGSTGMPLTSLSTEVTRAFWRVHTLRDHFWHRRDFSQALATIREVTSADANPPHGMRSSNWGATRGLFKTGPAYLMTSQATVEEQARWLEKIDPGYVLAYPSALLALTSHFARHNVRLKNLREVRTLGEIVEPRCRHTCQEVFGVPLVDMYTSQEVGYMALQCPEEASYHVQSENLLVEVLTEDGRVCQPGEIGRVVVSTLHNFAMPLIRYAIGDYAEVGEPCACGRGLPVLARILGRQRNMLILPDGNKIWPSWADATAVNLKRFPPVSQFQVVQKTVETLEVRLVASRRLTADEESAVRGMMLTGFGYQFSIVFEYVESIPRSPSGKFEDFRSEVSSGDRAS